MSTYAASGGVLPRERAHTFYHEGRSGSGWGQVGVAAVAVVLGITLIAGQISLATVHDIRSHVHQSLRNLQSGNATMQQTIHNSAASATMLKQLQVQRAALGKTTVALAAMNRSMAQILGVTNQLGSTVSAMRTTSGTLSGGVLGMSRDAQQIARSIGPLPTTVTAMGSSMRLIDTNSTAMVSELGAISAKMKAYGLPEAKEPAR